jgi:hypothetical protein
MASKLKPNSSLLSRTLTTLTLCRVPDTRDDLASAGRMFPLEGDTSAPAQVGAFYSRGKRCQPNELEPANGDLGQRQTCEN